jgi:phospholipase/lecithinase/hemolysin
MVTQNGAATAELMEQLVIASNLIQQTSLQQLNSTFLAAGGTQQLSIYDTYALFDNLLNNPPESAYGPSPNTADFCDECAGSTGACSPCQNPQSYFYQDRESLFQLFYLVAASNLST